MAFVWLDFFQYFHTPCVKKPYYLELLGYNIVRCNNLQRCDSLRKLKCHLIKIYGICGKPAHAWPWKCLWSCHNACGCLASRGQRRRWLNTNWCLPKKPKVGVRCGKSGCKPHPCWHAQRGKAQWQHCNTKKYWTNPYAVPINPLSHWAVVCMPTIGVWTNKTMLQD